MKAPTIVTTEIDGGATATEPVQTALLHGLIGSTILGVPVLALSMIKPLHLTNWQWLVLAMAAPIVIWGAATMDTLLSLGAIAAVDTIVLDKTGTVTTGKMSLIEIVTADGVDEDDVLWLVGALEDAAEHPIARAVAAGARARVGDLTRVRSFNNTPGLGVTGVVAGRAVTAGRAAFVADAGLEVPESLRTAMVAAQELGRTPIVAGWDGVAKAVIVVADTVKPTSAQAVARLRALGLTPVLLTGDNERAASAVADEVGIDTVIADVLPADKVNVITRLQSEGKVVAMVGDGVNDSAIEASDLTLVRGDLNAVADAIRLSRLTLSTIRTKLFLAFAYNLAALPLAAAGWLNPAIAGASMVLSSVFVASNSLRLRRFRAA